MGGIQQTFAQRHGIHDIGIAPSDLIRNIISVDTSLLLLRNATTFPLCDQFTDHKVPQQHITPVTAIIIFMFSAD